MNFTRNSRETKCQNAIAVCIKGFSEDPGRKTRRDFKTFSVAQYFQSASEVILIGCIAKRGARPEKPVIILRAAHRLCQQYYNLA